jgi:hypothetical protein
MLKLIFRDVANYHTSGHAAVFKLFVSVVLFQFAFLSLLSVSADFSDIPVLESSMYSSHFWWGFLGLFGALSLLFEKYILKDKVVLSLGYLSAIMSLILLSYDFVARKPPIHTGGILSVTAGIFLGGILYASIKRGSERF